MYVVTVSLLLNFIILIYLHIPVSKLIALIIGVWSTNL